MMSASLKKLPLTFDSLIRVDGTEEHYISLCFKDARDRDRRIAIPASKKRSARNVLEFLDNAGAALPNNPKSALEIVSKVLESGPKDELVVAASRTGWAGEEFVLPDRTLSSNRQPAIRHIAFYKGEAEQTETGSLPGWKRATAEVLARSQLAVAMLGLALSGSLLKYYPALTGLAVNLAGDSGAGKTSMLKLAQSVWSPVGNDDLPKLNVTLASLEQQCHAACDRFAAFDEFGASDLRAEGRQPVMQAFAFMVSGGSGKERSELGKQSVGHANLRFRIAAATSSEQPLANMVRGPRVGGAELRFIDIAIDGIASGGVLDPRDGSAATEKELGEVLEAMLTKLSSNHGLVGPRFVQKLIESGDLSKVVNSYVTDFVDAVRANDLSNVQHRYSASFGLMYAALRLARKFGLIDLKKAQIARAMHSFYERSEHHLRGKGKLVEALRGLHQLLTDEKRTPDRRQDGASSAIAFTREIGGVTQACINAKKLASEFEDATAARMEQEMLRAGIQKRDGKGKSRQQVEVTEGGKKQRERRLVIDIGLLAEFLDRAS